MPCGCHHLTFWGDWLNLYSVVWHDGDNFNPDQRKGDPMGKLLSCLFHICKTLKWVSHINTYSMVLIGTMCFMLYNYIWHINIRSICWYKYGHQGIPLPVIYKAGIDGYIKLILSCSHHQLCCNHLRSEKAGNTGFCCLCCASRLCFPENDVSDHRSTLCV